MTLPTVEHCRICGRRVLIQIRKGTRICSTICEKIDKGELPRSAIPPETEAPPSTDDLSCTDPDCECAK